jgi:hexosaminidase
MRKLVSLALAAALTVTTLRAQGIEHGVMPAPRSIVLAPGGVRVDSGLTVALTGFRDARLERATIRMIERFEARAAQPMSRSLGATSGARLVIDVKAAGFAVPDLREDESYTIDVDATRATLTANTVVGAMRGMETLLQLQAYDRTGGFLPAARISDAPRFPWRGVNIDVARHFHPVAAIKRTLDGMAAVKLNVLHWHLSDDQGFRADSRTFPRLTGLGSDSLFYTQDEMRDVVAYAADRGIRVVPEFDVPGHTTAWMVGYPELASAPGPYQIERRWGVFHPTMDPTRESTYQFLDRFIAEMVTIFPDRYWHIGGDEVDPTQWKASTSIQEWMTRNGVKDLHALQTHFNKRLFTMLDKHQREPVGWDEILQPDLPRNAVIQSWRGMNGLTQAAKQGRPAILSAPFYLDHIKTSAEMYREEIIPAGLTDAEAALVLGGEACMWAEYVTSETLDSRLWPRLAAVAERFWSPAHVTDVGDMYRRLDLVSRRLEEAGTLHASHTGRMLRRIAGSSDAATLETFLDYARPRGFAGRGTNQLSPLTRLIDAALPDPLGGWRMQLLAQRAVSGDTAAARMLRRDFARMATFETALHEMQPRVPLARDGFELSGALGTLARIGIEALDARRATTTPPAARSARSDSLLKSIEGKTFGLLRPVGAEAVRILLTN